MADEGRPLPDEAPLHDESTKTIVVRAVKSFASDNGTMLASALAYSTFFAIPAVLLLAVGAFTLVAGPGTIASLMQHFGKVMPGQATTLLGSSLQRLRSQPSAGLTMTIVGAVLAVWSTTGAMTTYMTALNLAYGIEDRRSFLRRRLVALEMVVVTGVAFLLVAVLLMFGPQVEKLVASHVGGAGTLVSWIWWIAQWPILILGLLVAFAALLFLGPDRKPRRWELLTPGAIIGTVLWLAASGAFAVYTAHFGSYNKTWGSLAAVIVMLTWLWLAAIALLLGAEVNAEVERSRGAASDRPAARGRSRTAVAG
ncbi:MAG: YihY/virulence factor BrkB family protein [Actinobacteria bacterium]|nr:YihY/virulence factor BrkB family protein [Actinomycetota bacterium]